MGARQGDFPRYGEVRWVNLDPVVGSEIGKTRPALVVSNDYSNENSATVTVLPIAGRPARRRYLNEVVIPKGVAGLSTDSRIKVNMIRTLDKGRVLGSIGDLPRDYYSDVERALKLHLNMALGGQNA